MKIIIVLILGMLTISSCTKQSATSCTAVPDQAPKIKGFRLGMTFSEIQSLLPNIPKPVSDRYGLAVVILGNGKKPNNMDKYYEDGNPVFVNAAPYEQLKDIKHLELDIVDDRLAAFKIFYPNDIKWKSADEFVTRINESLNLPGGWKKLGEDTADASYRWLKCSGFAVNAGLSSTDKFLEDYPFSQQHPFIELTYFELEELPRKRKSDERQFKDRLEENRKDRFKP